MEGNVQSVPASLFKISVDLAKFLNINVLQLRALDASEVLYLIKNLIEFNRKEEPQRKFNDGVPVLLGKRRVFADEADWLDPRKG